jgi:hypothetical protein
MTETARVRRFWCTRADRDVEVTFTEPRPFVSGRPAVKSCSAFEADEDIACPRSCVDTTYRRPCRPAVLMVPGLGQQRCDA